MPAATPSYAAAPTVTFPLERPRLRVRQGDKNPLGTLPYFIAGDENRLAAFACTSDRSVFDLGNPVLLIGPTGSGKTVIALHLAAREAASEVTEQGPDVVQYLPAVEFARLYANAVDADDLPAFRQMIDQAAVLVIDDLHLINTKPAAQDELALRLDQRSLQQKPTILTCSRLPTEVRGLRAELASRCLPGLTIPMSVPRGASRQVLLREFGLLHSIHLSPELLDALDAGLAADLPVRQLGAAIKQIDLWCRMNDCDANIDAAKAAINMAGLDNEVTIPRIGLAVAKYFGLKIADLRSSSRKQRLVRARSLAMLLCRRHTGKSMYQIGEYFGGRDHSTVLHAVRKTELLLDESNEMKLAAAEICEKLGIQ